LPTVQAVVRRGRQPIRQDREGHPAWLAESSPHPDALAPIIVALTKPAAVADDRLVTAERTPPWQ
jgi:hypothetical protein